MNPNKCHISQSGDNKFLARINYLFSLLYNIHKTNPHAEPFNLIKQPVSTLVRLLFAKQRIRDNNIYISENPRASSHSANHRSANNIIYMLYENDDDKDDLFIMFEPDRNKNTHKHTHTKFVERVIKLQSRNQCTLTSIEMARFTCAGWNCNLAPAFVVFEKGPFRSAYSCLIAYHARRKFSRLVRVIYIYRYNLYKMSFHNLPSVQPPRLYGYVLVYGGVVHICCSI